MNSNWVPQMAPKFVPEQIERSGYTNGIAASSHENPDYLSMYLIIGAIAGILLNTILIFKAKAKGKGYF